MFTLTIGANNLFNTYPDKIANSGINPIYVLTGSTADGQIYPRPGGPFGINGGFYYAKLRVKLGEGARVRAAPAPVPLPPPPPATQTCPDGSGDRGRGGMSGRRRHRRLRRPRLRRLPRQNAAKSSQLKVKREGPLRKGRPILCLRRLLIGLTGGRLTGASAPLLSAGDFDDGICEAAGLSASIAALTLAWTPAAQGASPTPVGAEHGMVVSAHRLASNAGIDVLKSGGNAVDAAVAVGYALAVTFPEAGNLGGGGFMTIRFHDGRTAFIDFREMAPGAATATMYQDANGNPVPRAAAAAIWRSAFQGPSPGSSLPGRSSAPARAPS